LHYVRQASRNCWSKALHREISPAQHQYSLYKQVLLYNLFTVAHSITFLCTAKRNVLKHELVLPFRILLEQVTPFLLERIRDLTGGASLAANIKLVLNNAAVGAQIAAEYAEQQGASGRREGRMSASRSKI
jgi:hypothetical protein